MATKKKGADAPTLVEENVPLSSYSRKSGRLDIFMVAQTGIHHGHGVKGNTQVIRRDEFIDAEGRECRTPFVSGNSLRHNLRAAGSQFALECMDVGDGCLDKGTVDLLFSGGHLGSGGSTVNLERARSLGRLFPHLEVMGYSAGNSMQPSRISVDNMHLICAENVWRMPDYLKSRPDLHPFMARRAASFVGIEFGTRHEATRSAAAAPLLTDGENQRLTQAFSEGKGKEAGSSQMIFDFEVIKPGSRFWTTVFFRELNELEFAALIGCFYRIQNGAGPTGGVLWTVGAKGNTGHGQVEVFIQGHFRDSVNPVGFHEVKGLIPARTVGEETALSAPDQTQDYKSHLYANREAILAALKEAVA